MVFLLSDQEYNLIARKVVSETILKEDGVAAPEGVKDSVKNS